MSRPSHPTSSSATAIPPLFDWGFYNRKRRDSGVDGPSLASKGVQRYVMAVVAVLFVSLPAVPKCTCPAP
eukprot:15445416-Alexandrium_andersonii.AAC.1